MSKAVAIDLGASSGRYALGSLINGRISFEVIEQIRHSPVPKNGRLQWDLDRIIGLCNRASEYARTSEATTIGIDSWGVDHGFLGLDGTLLHPPVCYRDTSHLAAFEKLKPYRRRLFELTGIQHQPFNTICQLLARLDEDPTIFTKVGGWMILPDLLGFLMSGERNHELTQASTTQLMGLDGEWSPEAFHLCGWPLPGENPKKPGTLGGVTTHGIRLAHVGSHDTASAVAGFGEIPKGQTFVNVGTWSLIGVILDEPINSEEAEANNFTNERTVDGRIRLLKNVPGFYVVNRIHEELGIPETVPHWLNSGTEWPYGVDLMHPDLFNPVSMVATCSSLADNAVPRNQKEWAGFTMASLTGTLAKLPDQLGRLTGQKYHSFRVGGGGSQSELFCQQLANRSGLAVHSGPAEVTVLGNLAMQFLASGNFSSYHEMYASIEASNSVKKFMPA